MEPPAKRRRLSENPHAIDDGADGDDEEWEECEGDDTSGDGPPQQREGSIEQDDGYQLAIEKAYADDRFRATMAHIFKKYGRDFEGIGDEIDLTTGEIVINNGHVENMRHEVDVGDVPRGYDQDVDEVDEDDDDGNLLEDLTDDETGQPHAMIDWAVDDDNDDDDVSRSWTSDADDAETPSDNTQLQRLQSFGPETLDYGEGPSLIRGLYGGGGGLRYASSLGDFGASPFAPAPWDLLPQAQERYEFPRQQGLSPIWARNHRSNDDEAETLSPSRAGMGLSKTKPAMKRLKAPPTTRAQNGRRRDYQRLAQRPIDASDLPGNTPAEGRRSMPLGKTSWAEAIEESDTTDDAVFTVGEMSQSSDTGDTTDEVPQPKPPQVSNPDSRTIPDSQDSYASLEAQPMQVSANPKPAQAPKSKGQDFDSECVLSDDESPLYSQQVAPSTTVDPSKPTEEAFPQPAVVPTPGLHADGTVVKRGRGRPRKWPPGYRPPRGPRKKPKPPLPEVSNLTRPLAIPAASQMLAMPAMTAAPMPQQIRNEAVPGLKRKRGRPRKSSLPGFVAQQNPKSHHIQGQTQQTDYQQPLFQPFQPGAQQALHYPFHPYLQQPVFQYPQQMAYQPMQPQYTPHPMFQFQQQAIQQPIQQLVRPSIFPYQPAQQSSPAQPVKRKRGRPRKYPVRFDSVYPGYVMNRKRNAAKKLQEGESPYQRLPGLQNSMTALLSGQSGRMMVSEDAWYNVARQLAQDISCIQGGGLYTSQVQAENHASYQTKSRPPSKGPEKSAPSFSGPQHTDGELVRVTELSEVSDIEGTMSTEYVPQDGDAAPTLDGQAVTDDALIEQASSLDPDTYETTFVQSHSTEMDIHCRPQFDEPVSPGSPAFDLDLIDPALIDPALTEQPPTNQSPTQSSANESPTTITQPDTFDPSLIDPALLVDVPDSPIEDDDGGFVVIGSPNSVTKNVQPSPSASNLPSSRQMSSPLKDYASRTPPPAPAQPPSSDTQISPESTRAGTPLHDHAEDDYGLPSSPEPFIRRFTTPCISEKEPAAKLVEPVHHQSPLAAQEVSQNTSSHVNDKCQEDAVVATTMVVTAIDANKPQLSELPATMGKMSVDTEPQLVAHNAEGFNLPVEPVEPVEVLPETIEFCQQPVKEPPICAESMEKPPDPFECEQDSRVAPMAQPQASPKVTKPRTPDPPNPVTILKQTPERSLRLHSSHVPKSAERCTPIFVESPLFVRSPTTNRPKKQLATERRTMGKLKQAILEPWQKSMASQLVTQKPMSLAKAKRSEPETVRWSNPPKPRTKLPQVPAPHSSKTMQTKKLPVPKRAALKPPAVEIAVSKAPASQDTISKAVKKPSRRSLLSLVSRGTDDKDLDDEADELGTPSTSIGSSSFKGSETFTPGESSRDTTSKKGVPRTETQHMPRKEKFQKEDSRQQRPHKDRGKANEKEKKRKRRHTDGARSKTTFGTTSGTGDKECGIDGYTCNRDFCFTCL